MNRGAWRVFFAWTVLGGALWGGMEPRASAQQPSHASAIVASFDPSPTAAADSAPPRIAADRPYPINLATAFELAGVQPIDIQVAAARIRAASAELDYAKLLWLPTLLVGTDYLRHDGQIQDSAGNISTTSFGSFMLGAGPSLVVGVTDAIFEPLAARQVVRARDAALQTARNDSLLAVADAYFSVQQSRGELAGAEDVVRRSVGLANQIQSLARRYSRNSRSRARGHWPSGVVSSCKRRASAGASRVPT